MQLSPFTKLLLSCAVVGAGLFIFKASLSEGELEAKGDETAALEARLKQKREDAGLDDPVVVHRKKVRSMVWHREFDRLEKIAAASRKKESAEGEEYVDLFYFYEWTGTLSPKHEEHFWATHLEHLTAWREAHPESLTPLLAMARYWTGYAWKARGSDYAYTVTEEGWKLYHERLIKSQRILDSIPKKMRTDPQYYSQGLTLAMGLGLPKEEALERFRSGLEVDKHYYPLYDGIVAFFLPRWHGDEGEVGRVIQQEVSQMGEHGDWALTRMVWALYRWEKEEVFNGHGIDYPPVKKVYEKWTSEWEDVETANYYCLYACIAGDSGAAKRMFDRIGDQFDEFCWGSEENFRKWQKRYG